MRHIPALAAFIAAFLAAAATVPAAPPAARSAVDEVALHWAARAAVARGVAYLQRQSQADDDGWAVPPFSHAKRVGTTNVVVRYSEKKAPTYVYETYTVYERRPGETSQSAKTLQRVQRQRVKGIKDPEGRTILVRDPKGPIERTESRPVYEKGGVKQWFYGRLGQNAMALYTLLRCGLPEEDETVQRLRQNLLDFVEMYGLPDSTWDIAWMTAAFSRLPDGDSALLCTNAVSKLLDGQILDGDARGLWGPVSIHVPLLSVAYLREQELSQRLQKAQLALKERPDARSRDKDVVWAEDALHKFQKDMRRIAMLALAFDGIDAPSVRLGDDVAPPVLVPGTLHYVFNQTTADMDCTSLALFALREAAHAGRLPVETWRPAMEGVRNVPPPEKSEAVLARAVHALTRLQQSPGGGWTECNLHQPVTSFDKLGKMIPGVPVDARSFKPLPAPETPLSCLQGYAALVNAAEAAGFQKVLARFRADLLRGRARAVSALAEIPAPAPKGPQPAALHASRHHSVNLVHLPGTRFQEERQVWLDAALDLVGRQQTNGAWRAVGRELALSSSASVRIATLERRDPKDKTKIMNRATAHIRANWHSDHLNWLRASDDTALATCYALLTLAEHARPPAVVCRWGEDPAPSPLADATLQGLAARLGIEWSYTVESFPLAFARIEATPLLFVEGRGTFSPDPSTAAALRDFLAGGGTILAHATATSSGLAFLSSFGDAMGQALGGTEPADVAGDDRILGGFAGKLGRPLRGLRRKDGSLAVALIPLSDTGGVADQTFAPGQAALLAQRMIERALDAALLAPGFPHNLGDLGDPDAVYADAMGYLRGMAKRDLGAVVASGEDVVEPEKNDDGAAPAAGESTEPDAPQPRAPAADEIL